MTTRIINATFLTLGFGFIPLQNASADCNFDKKIGSCTARITIDSTGGSKVSYTAEATVSSSASSCSKVDYYLDNTPNITVLKNSSSEGESFFSTKPISRKSISGIKCTTYANASKDAVKDGGAKAGAAFFAGHWKGSAGLLVFRGPVEVTLSVNGNTATGSTYFPGDGATEQVNGTIRGNALSYSYTNDGEQMDITLTRKSENTLTYKGAGSSGVTVTGSLTRQ